MQQGSAYEKILLFFYQRLISFEVSNHFQRNKNENENFQTILEKTFVDFFTFQQISLHHKWSGTRFYHQKVNYELLHELPNDSRIRKLQENFWNAWIWWQLPNQLPKSQILNWSVKSSKKVSCKTFHKKIYFEIYFDLIHFVKDCRYMLFLWH